MREQIPAFPEEVPEVMTGTPEHLNWERVSNWARTHGGSIVTILVILGSAFAGVRYIINSEVSDIRSDIATLKTNVSSLETSLGTTNRRIDDLLTKALDRAFPQATASREKIRSSLGPMRGVLQLAKDANVKLNPQLLRNYGQQVLTISGDPNTSGDVWGVLGSLLNYRSFLNVEDSPAAHEDFEPSMRSGWNMTAHFYVAVKGPGSITLTYPNRLVRASDSCVYQPLKSTWTATSEGHPFVRVTANGNPILTLDGFHLKNVIFDGVKVEYDGGPLMMEDVYFVNCRFDVKPTGPSRQFTLAILRNVPASFSAS